jgi:hypothetical protein
MYKMKKISLLFVSLLCIGGANAATPWWLQATVCRVNPNNCYAGMTGAGFDVEMWDANASCWGMKMVCPVATTADDNMPVMMGKNAIAARNGINVDYDINVLDGDCFGVRKTSENGTMASVDGRDVRVWCVGVLNNSDETLRNGEITFGTQPSCVDLAVDGWVATLNGKCYGKYYNPRDYYIECAGGGELPSRIISLGGARGMTSGDSSNIDYPVDTSAAKSVFDAMQSRSASQKSKYF